VRHRLGPLELVQVEKVHGARPEVTGQLERPVEERTDHGAPLDVGAHEEAVPRRRREGRHRDQLRVVADLGGGGGASPLEVEDELAPAV